MNWYEQKQEARRERLEERAERLRREGDARVNSGMERLRAIPFGQPILVGHHSEKRDRNYRAKAVRSVDKGMELRQAAGEMAARAASVGLGGISSDDPEAVQKLKEELAPLKAKQERMALANKLVRKQDRVALIAQGFPEKVVDLWLLTPSWGGKFRAYEPYELSNNSANIRRIEQRIEHLGRQATRVSTERTVGAVTIIENTEINRLQFKFPGKPSAAVRAVLKGRGFRWSPSEGAWQRQLSGCHSSFAAWVLEQIEAAA